MSPKVSRHPRPPLGTAPKPFFGAGRGTRICLTTREPSLLGCDANRRHPASSLLTPSSERVRQALRASSQKATFRAAPTTSARRRASTFAACQWTIWLEPISVRQDGSAARSTNTCARRTRRTPQGRSLHRRRARDALATARARVYRSISITFTSLLMRPSGSSGAGRLADRLIGVDDSLPSSTRCRRETSFTRRPDSIEPLLMQHATGAASANRSTTRAAL